MTKQYYRKRIPYSENQNIEWIEMNGREFYRFIKSLEGKDRYFIDFDDYVIESTKEQYEAWKKEKNRSYYLNNQAKEYVTVSFYSDFFGDGMNAEDVITDTSQNTEQTVVNKILLEQLQSVICQLSLEEQWIIQKLFFEKKTLRQLSSESGIPVMTLCDRKNSAIAKLKKLINL